jgi:aminopeptidase
MRDPRIDKLAHVLTHYSTAVKQGDVVMLIGPPFAAPLIVVLYREVLQAGGHPIVRMSPEECIRTLYEYGTDAQLSFVDPLERREVEIADVVIHVLAPENTHALAGVDPSKQAIYSRARRPLMDLFLQRAAEKSLRWVVTQLPCQAAAQDAGMSLPEYEDFLFATALLDHDDPPGAWRSLSNRQARLIDFLKQAGELRLTAPAGTDLRLTVEGRTWINGDGRENFPDGEVFTSPVEDATAGVVCFDFPALYKGREVRGARLAFRGGRVIDASAQYGEELLVSMLDQDPGARVLGEVAFGCNYGLTRYTHNTLIDEKMGGTFHLALGASYPATGGKNSSALHWDMVADLRCGGRIDVDGKTISTNGRFLREDWPGPPGLV